MPCFALKASPLPCAGILRRFYQHLNRESSILTDYIIPFYDVLHTQGREYIVNDILEVMRERGIKAGELKA